MAGRSVDEPHTARLPLDHPQRAAILAAHQQAMLDDAPGYVDPCSGLLVFTASYLVARGYCCDNGCRHCPYVI